ncbi:MAG TPA: GNAT family N-acetyltransferase [Acidimicrobiales bacterium]|nr:GNAT family N-acetyltransferase [Acidimicrobiales bacterium]
MELRRVRISDPDVEPLLSGLADEYRRRYGEQDELSSVPDVEFDPPSGLFLIAVEAGEVVAGGGFRYLETGVSEVKRMWTRDDRRRRGLASALLLALEAAAQEVGYKTLRLETGPAQPEAAALYEQRGYQRIPVFGRYQQALAFEVDLASAGPG